MKFLLLVCFFVLTTNVYSADWLELPQDSDEYQVFIDMDTTVTDKPIVEYWLKLEYEKLQKFPESNVKFDKVLFHFLISCTDKAETLDQEKYFREGVMIKSIRIEPEELTWKPVEPETTNELLLNKYCGEIKKPEQNEE